MVFSVRFLNVEVFARSLAVLLFPPRRVSGLRRVRSPSPVPRRLEVAVTLFV